MPLSEEQAKEIKAQLIQKIAELYPEQKQQLSQQILALNPEELEQFLKQNQIQLQQIKGQGSETGTKQCLFCSIVDENTPSYKIDENKDAIAVLEINPNSEGHSLIVPKIHIQETENIPDLAFKLAKKVAKKLKSKLPEKSEIEEVLISPAKVFDHMIINVIPKYKGKELKEKQKASEKELLKLHSLLQSKTKTKIINLDKKSGKKSKKQKSKKSKLPGPKETIKLPQRIP